MILKESELSLIKRGRTVFTTPERPRWQPGDVVRLRASGKDPGIHITVVRVEDRETGPFKVWFTHGDTRPEERFIASGWPDYTSDPFRAMRNEMQPVPDSPKERREREQWLVLAVRQVRSAPPSTTRRVLPSGRQFRSVREEWASVDVGEARRLRQRDSVERWSAVGSQTRVVRATYDAGSDEASRVVRLFVE